MTPLNPIMLIGFAALAVPIIIHLLNRSRYRVLKFGAMMFLRQAQHERAQTIKLQQILLLLLRCLLLALLVWAMCRPFTPGEKAPETTSRQPTPSCSTVRFRCSKARTKTVRLTAPKNTPCALSMSR